MTRLLLRIRFSLPAVPGVVIYSLPAWGANLTGVGTATPVLQLENKGFARRMHDRQDRRRIIVEPIDTQLASLEASLFGSVQEHFEEQLSTYSDEQLATIVDFLTHATRQSQEAMATLQQRAKSPARTKQS